MMRWLVLLTLGFCFGSSFLFAEILLESTSVYVIVFLRILIAGSILFGGVCAYYTVKFGSIMHNTVLLGIPRKTWGYLWVMAFLTYTPFLLVVYGQHYITGGLAAIINATTAFQGMILASLFLPNEKITLSRLVGVCISIFGVVIAIGLDDILAFDDNIIGGAYVFLGSTIIAIGLVWGKKHLQQVPAFVSAGSVHFIGAIQMLPFIVIWHGDALATLTAPVVYSLFSYALFATVFAFPLNFYLIKSAGASFASLNTIVLVPCAIILEYIVLGHHILITQVYGFILIFVGMVLMDKNRMGKIIMPS